MMYKLRKNNKGAALMMVLVAVALVTVLVTTMITASLINIQMKASERKGINNFYETDAYMDMVKAVIKTDADKVLDSAYKKLLVNYKGSADEEDNFYEDFVTEFVKSMVGMTPAEVDAAAAVGGNLTMTNNLEKYAGRILSYDGGTLDKAGKAFADFTESGGSLSDADDWDGGDLKKKLQISIDYIALEKNPSTAKYTGSVIIKGVKVTYTDSNNYQTSVKTDMKISAEYPHPKIMFDKIDPSEYIFISDGMLNSSISSASTNNVIGNVCAIEGIDIKNSSSFKAKKILTNGTIFVNPSSKLEVNTENASDEYFKTNYAMVNDLSKYVYEGRLLTEDTGNNDTDLDAESFVINTDAVWANNIEINGGTYEGTGNVYLTDDLTFINKKAAYPVSSATFKKETGSVNNFVGFGNGKRIAANNSSIIFNTDKFYLNMADLSKLVLSGNALIHIDRNDATVSEITEGESISYYKLQQIYLVPTKLLGTKIGSNPTLVADIDVSTFDPVNYFKDLYAAYSSGSTPADVKAVADFEDQYGINFATLVSKLDSAMPVKFDITPNGQAYMFFNFKDVDSARWYMQQYYNNNSAVVDKLLSDLSVSTKIADLPGRSILGNYVSKSGLDTSKTALDSTSQSYTADFNTYYKQLLGSLNSKGVGGVTIGANVSIYKNLVDDVNVSKIETSSTVRNKEEDGDSKSTYYNHYVVRYYNSADGSSVLDGMSALGYGGEPNHADPDDTKVPGIIIANGDVTLSGPKFYGLIVASGDVNVNTGVEGLVIAKGKITCFDNVTYECDREMIYNMLHDDALSRLISKYLKCYDGQASSSGEKNVYTQAVKIEYDNWQENPD